MINIYASNIVDLLYKVHAEGIRSIDSIRDGGMELLIDGDEPSAAALNDVRIDPGHARTCLSAGMFRLGAVAVFLVTVDATADSAVQRIVKEDELAGAVRDGSYSSKWRGQLVATGLLVTQKPALRQNG